MDERDVDAHLRLRVAHRQWLRLIRGIFVVFAGVVAVALFLATKNGQWVSVGLLSGLLLSVPFIERLIERGPK